MDTFKHILKLCLMAGMLVTGGHCWKRKQELSENWYHGHQTHNPFVHSPFSSFPGHFHSVLDDSSFWNTFMNIFPIDNGYDVIDCHKKQKNTHTNTNVDMCLDEWEQEQYVQWNNDYQGRRKAFDLRENKAKEQYIAEVTVEKNRRMELEKLQQDRKNDEHQRQELNKLQQLRENEEKQRLEVHKFQQQKEQQNGRNELEKLQQLRQTEEKQRLELGKLQQEEIYRMELERKEAELKQKRQLFANSNEQFNRRNSRPRAENKIPPTSNKNTDQQSYENAPTTAVDANQIASMNIPGFKSKHISIKTVDGVLHIRGYKESLNSPDSSFVEQFHKTFTISRDIDPKSLQATIDSKGILSITGKLLSNGQNVPEHEDLIEFLDVDSETHEQLQTQDPVKLDNEQFYSETEYEDDDVIVEVVV